MENKMNQIQALQQQLSHCLKSEYDIGGELRFFSEGVDNAVFRLKDARLGQLVIRTPWRADEELETRSLEKEAQLTAYCSVHGIPVPTVHHLHLGAEIRFLVSELIESDQAPIDAEKMGRMIGAVHQMPVNKLKLVDQEDDPFEAIVAKRIAARIVEVNQLTGRKLPILPTTFLQTILQSVKEKRVLLHLDVRRPNFLGQHGNIKALIDWDNAYVGPPVAELMRISESAEIDEAAFLQGYPESERLLQTKPIIQTIYRLDTALMLVILFTLHEKDAGKAAHYLERVERYCVEVKESIISR